MSNRARRKRILVGRTRSLTGAAPAAETAQGVEINLVQASAIGSGVIVENSGGDLGGGIIKNVAIMSAGTAWPLGREPFDIDSVCLQQLTDLINGVPGGIKSRLTHPELQAKPGTGYVDEICWLVGRVNNARVVGDQVRADAQIASYADLSPNGRIGSLVKDIAARSPADCGMSVRALFVFKERQGQFPLARVIGCTACDFVGTAAANPNGLLAGTNSQNRGAGDGSPAQSKNHQGESTMKLSTKQRAYLASCGLAKDATAEQVEVCLSGLKPEQKSYLESLKDDFQTPEAEPVETPESVPASLAGSPPPASSPAVSEAQKQQIAEQALADDKKRREGIMALARENNLPEKWAQGLCNRDVSLAEAQRLAELAKTMELVRQPAGSRVEVGEDMALAGLRPAISDAICLRAGVGLYEYDRYGRALREADGRTLRRRQPHQRATQFQGLSLTRTAQEFLMLYGVAQARHLSDRDILELALTGRLDREGETISLAMSTSDFPSILGSTMRNTIRAMYAEAEQEAVWTQWCGRVVLPDYRPMDLTSVSEVPDLLLRPEGQEVRFATFTDGHETIQVFMFSRGMKFTQQAQRNDTFGVFARQIRNFASAQIRLLDRGSTAILTANANMADGKPLFHADHNNIPAADGALSVSTLSAARTALRTQVGMRTAEDGDNGPAVLNIRAKTLLTAAAIEDTARVLLASEYDPAVGVGVANPVRNAAAIVGNPYLDDAGAAASWFLQGDPSGPGGGVQVAFLQGEEVPETRTQVDFRTGDLEVICEAKAGFKADDFRGMYRGHA